MSIRALIADQVPNAPSSDSLADRVTYARDSWQRGLIELAEGGMVNAGRMPSAVVWPTTTDDVQRLVELARREALTLVPFGAGSGVCGGIAGDERTVVVDLKRLDGWHVDRERQVLSAGPGVTGISLENKLQQQGLTIGHFPSSIICSTVGGWVAGRGAGQCSSRYGKIEDMLLGAECVLGTGERVDFRRRSNDFNLLPLMIGSEGALGFLTKLDLRVHPLPQKRRFAAFHLKNGRAGMAAVRDLMQENLRPTVARLYDALDTLLMEHSSGQRHQAAHTPKDGALAVLGRRGLAAFLSRASLFNGAVNLLERSPFGRWILILIFEGEGADEDMQRAGRIVSREGGREVGEGPARRWYEHRYAVSWKQISVFRAGGFNDTLEVAAPWSRLEELEQAVRSALGRHVVVLEHLSHAYPDGCSIYFTFIGGKHSQPSALGTYDSAWRDALEAARAAGGAISHHHGIGRSKAHALERDLGQASSVLRRVLRAWDPDALMNPGVLLPLTAATTAEPDPEYPAFGIDSSSELITAEGSTSLREIERLLASRGYSLAARPPLELTLGEWIARGLPGMEDAWADPAHHVLAGLQAQLFSGESLVLPPVPRRATGPDLTALVLGAQGRFANVSRATLCIRKSNAAPVRPLAFQAEREPSPNDGERGALAQLTAGVLGSVR